MKNSTEYPVFPCQLNKKPYTDHGFKNATTDKAIIADWWCDWPDALTGMPTGKASGFVVLDVDEKNGNSGSDSLYSLEEMYGKIPETWIVLTPSGGFHYWFKHPEKRIDTSSNRIGAGLDVRGDGGYVIVPDSRGYEWEASNPKHCAEMPEWLIEICNRRPKKIVAKESGLVIKNKDGYMDRLPPTSNVSIPKGDYQAMFVGWHATRHGSFVLKKGQARIILRFNVMAGGNEYILHAYRTVSIRRNGELSVGLSNNLAKDLTAVAGNHENGWPVQLNLDDIDINLFSGKQLFVSVRDTTKKRVHIDGKVVFTNTTETYSLVSSVGLRRTQTTP